MDWLIKWFLCVFSCFFINHAVASQIIIPPRAINLLTWSDYMDVPLKAKLEKACGVSVSYDEYYSNNEFLRRFLSSKDRYDIIIFSNTILPVIEKNIALKKSELWKKSAYYHPVIRDHFLESSYPKNVAYFAHSFSGFLWNDRVISMTSSDNIASLFEKVKNKKIIFMDDAVEVYNLISKAYEEKHKVFALSVFEEKFNQLVNPRKAMITNEPLSDMLNDGVAFAFSWSGDAFQYLSGHLNSGWHFLVHPKISYVSTDLIAHLNAKLTTVCVTDFLSSREILKEIQSKTYYFSPYGDPVVNGSTSFYENYHLLFNEGGGVVQWINPVDAYLFDRLGHFWKMLRSKGNHFR